MKWSILLIMLASSCVSRNKRDYLPSRLLVRSVDDVLEDSSCTAGQVSYSRCVRPILVARCYGCHTDTSTHKDRNEFVFLNNFSVLQRYALESYQGRLEKKLQTHVKAIDGYRPMPARKIPPAEISLLDAWIAKGAMED